jgi:hypothetical protein
MACVAPSLGVWAAAEILQVTAKSGVLRRGPSGTTAHSTALNNASAAAATAGWLALTKLPPMAAARSGGGQMFTDGGVLLGSVVVGASAEMLSLGWACRISAGFGLLATLQVAKAKKLWEIDVTQGRATAVTAVAIAAAAAASVLCVPKCLGICLRRSRPSSQAASPLRLPLGVHWGPIHGGGGRYSCA